MLASGQVIEAIAERLRTVWPVTVYTDRAWPLDVLPAWRVFEADETIGPLTVHGLQQHDLSIEAVGCVRAVDGLDDALRAMAAQALQALNTPSAVMGWTLTGIDRAMQSEDEAAIGQVTLRGLVTFATAPAEPETLILIS
jgi:hypothetical protein